MILTVIGSGSKGNCYLLHNDKECLILEAGVPFKSVLRALKGDISKVKGCLVTHEHQDHSKFVKDIILHAIPVFATRGTKDALLEANRSDRINSLLKRGVTALEIHKGDTYKVRNIGSKFKILPFKTVHDATEPCGFFIHHPETGNVMFATDTAYIPNTFKDVSTMLIECNYDEDLLQARTDIPESLKDRIRESHQSIDTCIEAIRANRDQPTLRQAVLLHLSDGDGGDPEQVTKRVERKTGLFAYMAKPGLEINIDKLPF